MTEVILEWEEWVVGEAEVILALRTSFFMTPVMLNQCAARACNIDAGHTAAEVASGGLSAFYAEKEEVQVELAEVAHRAIFRYQRKIKEALDPHEVGDGGWLYLDEHEIEAGTKRAKTALPPV